MKRVLLALLVAGVLFAAVYASAASVDVFGGIIQEGIDEDLTCADYIKVAGWGFNWDDTVTFVRFEAMPDECEHVDVFIQVLAGDDSVLAQSSTLEASTHPFSTSSDWRIYFDAVNPEDIAGLHVWIEGADTY